jgi:sigma-E factor negative regulatory protein RseB
MWGQRARVIAFAAGALLSAPALSQDTRSRVPAGQPRSALQWIQAIQDAAVRVNYIGTVVYQSGGEIRTSRITHLFDGTQSRERVQTLDGKPREFIRLRNQRNDEVQCFFPESRRIVVEHRALEDPFPALTGASPEMILEHYAVRIGSLERVAGIECQLVKLEPRDLLRYGYRLCVDPATGLLLRAQTINERHDVLEQVAFTDVRIGGRVDPSRLKPAWATDGWTVERSDYRPADLARLGWVVPPLAGFHRTKEVSRRMGSSDVVQVVFSDGLATLSVFIEPMTDAKGSPDNVQSVGPTSAVSRRIGDSLVTVVGEVPPLAVRTVAASVELRAPR